MNPFIKKLFFIALLLPTLSFFAQDIITKKDGTTLEVIIKEVTNNEIKYVEFKDPNGVLFSIDKALVSDVKFKYGKELAVKNPEENNLYFIDDKINNYMLNFSALGGNTLGLAYERVLKPGQSILGEVKIYGIGIKTFDEEKRNGFGLDFAYRLKTKSLFNNPNSYRPKHILHGAYFSPVIGFSTGEFKYDDFGYVDDLNRNKIKHTIFHFGIQYGKQWILQKKVSIDASIGFHYYVGDDDNSYDTLHLGNMIGSENKLFAFNLRIGFLGGKESIVKK